MSSEKIKLPILKSPYLYYGTAAIVALLFLTAVLLPMSSNPKFCNLCHEMKPQIDAWKKSSHANVTCYGCHSEPGVVGFLKDKIFVGTPTVIAKLSGNFELPINGKSVVSEHISSEPCLSCHNPFVRKFTVSAGIKVTNVTHRKHEDAGVSCPTCHNRVAHKDMIDYNKGSEKEHKYLDGMKMTQGCVRCHSQENPKTVGGKVAPTACSVCHAPEFKLKPKSHDDKLWPLDPTSKLAKHSKLAKKDINYCYGCHSQKTFCDTRCHGGITIPHVSNWKKIHFNEAKKDKERCMRCHGTGQFCANCHHRPLAEKVQISGPWYSPSPGESIHPKVIRALSTARYCFKCHDATFCARCHIKHLGQLGLPKW